MNELNNKKFTQLDDYLNEMRTSQPLFNAEDYNEIYKHSLLSESKIKKLFRKIGGMKMIITVLTTALIIFTAIMWNTQADIETNLNQAIANSNSVIEFIKESVVEEIGSYKKYDASSASNDSQNADSVDPYYITSEQEMQMAIDSYHIPKERGDNPAPFSNLPINGVEVPEICKKDGYIYPSVDRDYEPIFMLNPNPEVKSKDLHWQDVDVPRAHHLQTKWYFFHHYDIEYRNPRIIDPGQTFTSISVQIEPEDLIRIESELEGLLNNKMDINILKKLAYVPFADFYSSLNNVTENLKNPNINIDAVRLYVLICRSYTNVYMNGYVFEKHGLILDKKTLERLGIEFGDNYYSVPNDEFFPAKSHSSENPFDKYSDAGYTFNKGQGVFVYKNYLRKWGWGKGSDRTADSLKKRTDISAYVKDPEDVKSPGIVVLHDDKILPPNSFSKYRRTSTVCSSILGNYAIKTAVCLQFPNDDKTKELKEIGNKIGELRAKSAANPDSDQYDAIIDSLKRDYNYKEADVKLNVLIPVDIQTPYYNWSVQKLKDELGNYSTARLWYYPNEEFLSALPREIRHQLEDEMELLQAIRTGEMTPKSACDALGGESLLGVCDFNYSERISDIKVYPNPIYNNKVTVSLFINESQFVKMSLLDYKGVFVKDMLAWRTLNKGSQKIKLDCSGLAVGAYTLIITNDKGEAIPKKILIKR